MTIYTSEVLVSTPFLVDEFEILQGETDKGGTAARRTEGV